MTDLFNDRASGTNSRCGRCVVVGITRVILPPALSPERLIFRMKQFVDLIPVVCFVAIYFATRDMILATTVLIGVTVLQLAYVWFTERKIEKPLLYTSLAVFLLGGMTVFFKDNTFIKWKPTVIYWVFALILAASHFFGERPLVQKMMEGLLKQVPDMKLDVPARAWVHLSVAWVVFFGAMGGINLFVAYQFEEATWVSFKLFGLTGLLMIFMFGQFGYLSRFQTSEKSDS